MPTKEIIELYFKRLGERKGWEESIDNDMIFTGAITMTAGKEAYIQTTRQFLQVVTGLQIKDLVIEGDKACVEVHYAIVSPKGNGSVCKVAEFLCVKNGNIASSTIFFDTAAFREFMAKG